MKNNHNIRLLALHNFLTGFVPFAPIAILYFQRVTGSFASGMSIFAVAMFSTALFEIPTGILSDKVGRRLTVVLGSFSYFIAYIFYAIGLSYAHLLIGAVFVGIGKAFHSGSNDALLYDTLREHKKENRFDHYLGKVNSSLHAALAISALLGGVIAYFSFAAVMWVSVIPQLINVIISFGFREPKVHTEKFDANVYAHLTDAAKKFFKNKRLMVLTFSGVISFALGEAIFQFRAAFVEQLWPIWAIGLLGVISNIGASWSYFYSGSLLKRFGGKTMIVGGKIYSRVAQILGYGFPTVFSPLIIATPSLFFGVIGSARANLFQKEFTHHQRATMDSIRSLFNNLGFVIASLAIGFGADKIGPAKIVLLAQFILIIPIFLYVKFFKMEQKK